MSVSGGANRIVSCGTESIRRNNEINLTPTILARILANTLFWLPVLHISIRVLLGPESEREHVTNPVKIVLLSAGLCDAR